MKLTVCAGGDEDGFVFGEIRVEPHFNFALFGNENHFLADVEVSYLFV